MAFDAHQNLAISTVATAPSPATSGTSLVVAGAQGVRFGAVPFNATVWPSNALPSPANAEIVRVTARTTDTLTFTRTQEGTSARAILVGDLIAATITAKTLTDLETQAALLAAANTFTATPQQIRTAGTPALALHDLSGPATTRHWDLVNDAQRVHVRTLDDAGSSVLGTPLQLTRPGDAHVQRDLYEKGRATALGDWTSNPAYLPAGFTGTYVYTLVGRALHLVVYASGTPGAVSVLSMGLPLAPTFPFNQLFGYFTGSAWTTGITVFEFGNTTVNLYPTPAPFPSGSFYITMTVSFPI